MSFFGDLDGIDPTQSRPCFFPTHWCRRGIQRFFHLDTAGLEVGQLTGKERGSRLSFLRGAFSRLWPLQKKQILPPKQFWLIFCVQMGYDSVLFNFSPAPRRPVSWERCLELLLSICCLYAGWSGVPGRDAGTVEKRMAFAWELEDPPKQPKRLGVNKQRSSSKAILWQKAQKFFRWCVDHVRSAFL